MKQIIRMVLAIFMMVSLLTGCADANMVQEPETTGATETVAVEIETEAVTEAPTEPTLSPEEVLYNSLSDRMKQAVDFGLIPLEEMENPDRVVTVGEASALLQKAFLHRTGVESMTLNDLINTPDYSTRNATRGWILNIPGLVDMELSEGDAYQNYEQWLKYLNSNGPENLWWSYRARTNATVLTFGSSDTRMFDQDGDVYIDNVGITYALDLDSCCDYMKSDLLYGPAENNKRFLDVSGYAMCIYDQTNGKKFFELEDGYVNPAKELTVADLAEYALTFYHYPNPMAYPEYVALEDVGAFNSEIISEDLLTKETDLPDASCENLPSNWHGVVMDDFQFIDSHTSHTDSEIYEYEIQQVKEAGFNFIGLNLDFSWLQDNSLNDKQRDAYVNFVNKEDVGKFSLERLEKLDQVIAWCMKYDIHVNLRATALGGQNGSTNMYWEIDRNMDKHTDEFAKMWQAIARRYADIPNTYLSFTLFTGDYIVRNKFLVPSVASIREESLDRCIIADICGWNMKAKEFAELGVALSVKLYDDEKTGEILNLQNNAYWGRDLQMNNQGKKVVDTFNWPYKDKISAQELISHERYAKGESLLMVAETAKEYGVGFMLGDFGVTYRGDWWYTYSRTRYNDEAYHAMISDVLTTVEDMGYGWCFNQWYGPYGVAFSIPAIKDSTYVQVDDYDYYIDQGMMGLFRNLNGVA